MPPIEPNKTPAADPGFEPIDGIEGWPGARDLPVAGPSGRLVWVVRSVLVAMAVVLAAVFVTAAWLNPYDADGNPRTMATHTQLGMPPCNMVQLIGKPCPACGMTTSFALLIHGDPANSLRANWVGTLLALFWLALIPWAVVSAVRGRYLFVRSAEMASTAAVVALLVLMFARWAVVLLT